MIWLTLAAAVLVLGLPIVVSNYLSWRAEQDQDIPLDRVEKDA